MPPLAGTPAAVMHSNTQQLPFAACPLLPAAHQYAVYVVSWHAAVGHNLYELLLCEKLQLHGATTKQSGCVGARNRRTGRHGASAHTSSGEIGRTGGGGILV